MTCIAQQGKTGKRLADDLKKRSAAVRKWRSKPSSAAA